LQSWFGFQVGLGVVVTVFAGAQGVPEVGFAGREMLLDQSLAATTIT
jgi:hypothetical protein